MTYTVHATVDLGIGLWIEPRGNSEATAAGLPRIRGDTLPRLGEPRNCQFVKFADSTKAT